MVDYNLEIIRADAELTTEYIAGAELDNKERANQLMLYLKFTIGSLTSFQIKVEFSDDGVTYYQQTFESISGAVATCSPGYFSFTPTGDQNYVIAIPIKCSKIKVSAKGTGTVTGSSLQIRAAFGEA